MLARPVYQAARPTISRPRNKAAEQKRALYKASLLLSRAKYVVMISRRIIRPRRPAPLARASSNISCLADNRRALSIFAGIIMSASGA